MEKSNRSKETSMTMKLIKTMKVQVNSVPNKHKPSWSQFNNQIPKPKKLFPKPNRPLPLQQQLANCSVLSI